MRDLTHLEPYRLRGHNLWGDWEGDETCGAFEIPSCVDRKPLRVIASSAYDWDHVSVSRPTRCPTWGEMEQIAKLFFEDHEDAMQLHVPEADHINYHPWCLHWWRPWKVAIPRPPPIMVGVKL